MLGLPNIGLAYRTYIVGDFRYASDLATVADAFVNTSALRPAIEGMSGHSTGEGVHRESGRTLHVGVGAVRQHLEMEDNSLC